jgi:hypothetical protein
MAQKKIIFKPNQNPSKLQIFKDHQQQLHAQLTQNSTPNPIQLMPPNQETQIPRKSHHHHHPAPNARPFPKSIKNPIYLQSISSCAALFALARPLFMVSGACYLVRGSGRKGSL